MKAGLKGIVLFISLLLMIPGIVNSQKRFYAATDAREVLTNSYFEVRFVLENSNGSDFQAPDFSKFEIVSGPATSSQISITNGRRTQKKSYTYVLLADLEGTFDIKPATINVGRKTLSTEALEIKVIKRKAGAGKRASDKDVFVRAELSDSLVYPGQQILLTYVLYSRKRVSGYNYLSNPDYEGFFTQEINTRDRAERRIIDGVEFQSQVFKTIALFPQKLGELYVEPVQFSLGIAGNNDPFSSFFNRSKQVPVSTNDNWVKVIPLPENAPENFKGAIGKYNMTARLSNRQATTDDALSLKMTIEGNGLSKFIEAPDLNLGDQFDVYDPRVIDDQIYATEDDIVSKKTFEYLLVPKKEGRKRFKVAFSYFDTDSARYETLYSPMFIVTITAGKNTLSGLSPEEILEKYKLRPMMMDNSLKKDPKFFTGSPIFFGLITLLLLFIPAMLLWKFYLIKKGKIDPQELRKKRAAKEAEKRLEEAKRLLDGSDNASFYKAISEALEKYMMDKFSISTSELSKENINAQLLDRNLDSESIQNYFQILEKCELALFGGTTPQANNDIYARADELMRKMLINLEKQG